MKVFNVEDNELKIYVQLEDLLMLNKNDKEMPESIYSKRFIKVDDYNSENFIVFDDYEAIKYFYSIDWIIDYRAIRNLQRTEIEKKVEIIEQEQQEIIKTMDTIIDNENEELLMKKYNLMRKFELLDYKKNSIIQILKFKIGKKALNLPLVPDSDGFIYVDETNPDYEAILSLDFNKMLIYRKDGNKISIFERLPQELYNTCISILEFSTELTDYEELKYISSDNKYFVVELKNKEKSKFEFKNKVKELIKPFSSK